MPVPQTTTIRAVTRDEGSPIPNPDPSPNLRPSRPARWNRAVVAYDRRLSLPDLEDSERADALAGRAMVALLGGCTQEAAADARLAVRWADRSGRSRARSRAEEVLALVAVCAGDGAEALHHARRAVTGAPPPGRSIDGPGVSTHLTLAVAELVHGSPSLSVAAHRAWDDRYREAGGAPCTHPLGALDACALLVGGDLVAARVAVAAHDGAAAGQPGVLARAVAHHVRQLSGETVATEQLHAVARQAFSLARIGTPAAELAVRLAAASLDTAGDPASAADWLAEAWGLVARRPAIHTIVPDLVRLNRNVRPDVAADATEAAEARARCTRDAVDRANAAAALGHLGRDASALLEAAGHYARAGWHLAALRVRSQAVALADEAGDAGSARAMAVDVVDAWTTMGAAPPGWLVADVAR